MKENTFPILLRRRDLRLKRCDRGKNGASLFWNEIIHIQSFLRYLCLSHLALRSSLMIVFAQLPAATTTADSFEFVISAEDDRRYEHHSSFPRDCFFYFDLLLFSLPLYFSLLSLSSLLLRFRIDWGPRAFEKFVSCIFGVVKRINVQLKKFLVSATGGRIDNDDDDDDGSSLLARHPLLTFACFCWLLVVRILFLSRLSMYRLIFLHANEKVSV